MENSGSSSLIETTRKAEVDSFERIESKPRILAIESCGIREYLEYMSNGKVFYRKNSEDGVLREEITVSCKRFSEDRKQKILEIEKQRLKERNEKLNKVMYV